MTASPETLQSFLSRVRGAKGVDGELDAALVEAFGTKGPNGVPYCAGILGIAPLTSSIDAALALVERCLPLSFVRMETGGTASIMLTNYHVEEHRAESIPLAILDALLSALIGKATPQTTKNRASP